MGMEERFLSIAGRLFSPCNLYLWPLPLSMVYCTWATWTFLWIPQTHLAHSHLRAVALALPSTQKALPLGLCMPGFFRFFRYELKQHLCGELFPDHQLQLANLSITSAPTQREPNLSVTFSVLLSSWNSLLLEIGSFIFCLFLVFPLHQSISSVKTGSFSVLFTVTSSVQLLARGTNVMNICWMNKWLNEHTFFHLDLEEFFSCII